MCVDCLFLRSPSRVPSRSRIFLFFFHVSRRSRQKTMLKEGGGKGKGKGRGKDRGSSAGVFVLFSPCLGGGGDGGVNLFFSFAIINGGR